MKKIALILLIAFTVNAYGQDKGIGLRLGDLNGVTFKKYGSGSDLEFSIGQSPYLYDNFNYNDYFLDIYAVENNLNLTDLQYLSFNRSTPISLHGRLLFHKKLDKIGDESVSGLVWYYGLGAQIRTRSMEYSYRYKLDGSNEWIYATTDRVRDLDIGGEGILGLEYTAKEIPIAFFVDVNLFLELIDDPFNIWFQGGLGARYKF